MMKIMLTSILLTLVWSSVVYGKKKGSPNQTVPPVVMPKSQLKRWLGGVCDF